MEHVIEWQPYYSVGEDVLDEQHKALLGVIEDLLGAVHASGQLIAAEDSLRRLEEYTNEHFRYEERVMQDCHFPDYESHREMHEEMRRHVDEMVENSNGDGAGDMLRLLKRWWLEHIRKWDKAYVPYLQLETLRPKRKGRSK